MDLQASAEAEEFSVDNCCPYIEIERKIADEYLVAATPLAYFTPPFQAFLRTLVGKTEFAFLMIDSVPFVTWGMLEPYSAYGSEPDQSWMAIAVQTKTILGPWSQPE